MIDAGERNSRVTIQAPIRTEGPSGAPRTTWTDVRSVWASVRPTAATSRYGVEQVEGQVSYIVRMAYAPDVLPKHRLIWRGRTLAIVGAYDPDGSRAELLLTCNERVSA